MIILDVPHFLLPAPPAGQPEPANLPALPHGELEALQNRVAQPPSAVQLLDNARVAVQSLDDNSCQYQTSNDRPCPRPVIHYSDQEKPEDYCAAHLAWIEGVENRFDLSYPDSPQALLDLLAHTAAQVLNHKISHQQALVIMHLVRAMERQTRWL